MKLKVISDGKCGFNTKVVNAETGEIIRYVSAIEFKLDANKRLFADVHLTVNDVQIELDLTVSKETSEKIQEQVAAGDEKYSKGFVVLNQDDKK